MNVVNHFNGLNGSSVTRAAIIKMIAQAQDQEQYAVAERLKNVLSANPEDTKFRFKIQDPAIEVVPASILCSLEHEDHNHEQAYGLGTPVSPNEIYSYVTDLILNTIKNVGHLPWQKDWVGSGEEKQARNYVSKKPYSGINFVLLNFEVLHDKNGDPYLAPIKFKQPYYLTFNQIKDSGAKLKKGAIASRVIYYTQILKYKSDTHDFKGGDAKKFEDFVKENGITEADIKGNLTKIPVIKYYNVFRADDCTGLTFPKPVAVKVVQPIEACQAIIDNFKNPPKYTFVGTSAHYVPSKDVLNMPKIQAFNKEASYYCTFFHEMIHSTGHEKRVNRNFPAKPDKKEYAFEELIAELGAVFLCSQSGILFETRENSAKYLAGWNKALVTQLESDNRFFLKAAAQAQKASDYILDRNAAGTPNYLQKAAKAVAKIKPVKKAVRKTVKPSVDKEHLEKVNPKGYANKPKSTSVATAIEQVLNTGKYHPVKSMQANVLYNLLKDVEDITAEDIQLKTNDFQQGILEGISEKYIFYYDGHDTITLYPQGLKLIEAIKGRLVSLKNQKQQLSLFDGLKGRKKPVVKKGLGTAAQEIESEREDIEPELPRPVTKAAVSNNPRVQKIGCSSDKAPSEFFTVNGEVGKFLQRVEKKPVQSVVITMDGEQGAGKTTAMYKFMDAFGTPGNSCLFLSLEEHPDSQLAKDKVGKYLTPEAQQNIDTVADVTDMSDLYSLVKDYDIIFIDSWQKLQRMVGTIRLDEDLRKKFNGKVFVIIFQQTTTGRTKGGAEVVFDGDIIIKMVKEARFEDNYAWFDKNRYTLVPLETMRYNIASGTVYNPEATAEPEQVEDNAPTEKPQLLFKVV